MTKKRKALLGAMALCLCGGAVGAFALTYQGADASDAAAFDKALYLYWEDGKTSSTIANVEDVNVTNPIYRYLTVTPKTSSSLAGTVTVSFALTHGNETATTGVYYSLQGLELSVYKTETLLDDSTVAEGIANLTAEKTITVSENPMAGEISIIQGAVMIDVAEGNTASSYYVLGFKRTQEGKDASFKFGGELTISQSFVAK